MKGMSTLSEVSTLDGLYKNWREAPRRWGHPLHSVCSYFAMFPPQLAHFMIRWLTSPGEAVYDPFSGRGTVPLEALLLGRDAYASDANPLAVALSKAKTALPAQSQVVNRIAAIQERYVSSQVEIGDTPADIRMLYSDHTLRQLLFLRSSLDDEILEDRLIKAMVLGMLHANHSAAGATAGFSISMPNTFAMSPGYVRRYIAEHDLKRPDVNVFDMLLSKIEKLHLGERSMHSGTAWEQDATLPAPKRLQAEKVKLILTSPPYLEVIKYGKYNWVRLWFLGEDARSVDEKLMASGSLTRYLEFMTAVLEQAKTVIADDGFVCLVIGDVRRGTEDLNLAEAVWKNVAADRGWHLHGIAEDRLPTQHKVSRIWKNNSGRATKVDRILIMSPSKVELPRVVRPTWDKPLLPTKEVA